MSIYQGDTKISGNAMLVALPMFFATYQPRKLNNPSWLRAEPYSWHSADVYVSAYAHLADNISGVTAETETIAGTTITFYKLSDEIKVVLPDQQTNLDTIYNATGIGYYFVLDTTNRQFKLPRNIYGFTGYRGDVGGYVAPGLPNITGELDFSSYPSGLVESGYTFTGAIKAKFASGSLAFSPGSSNTRLTGISIDASESNSVYGNAPTVQPPATQSYLYFYVGNTVQNETTVDVGEMTEALNSKADTNLLNVTGTSGFRRLVEVYNNGASWYKVFDEYDPVTGAFIGKWCEQGGSTIFANYVTTIYLAKTYRDTNYSLLITPWGWPSNPSEWIAGGAKYTDSFEIRSTTALDMSGTWRTEGYLAIQ